MMILLGNVDSIRFISRVAVIRLSTILRFRLVVHRPPFKDSPAKLINPSKSF